MAADPHERDHSLEDTIIGDSLRDSIPPRLIVSETVGPDHAGLDHAEPDHAEPDHAEANTIIVSRAGSRQLDVSLAEYAMPATADVPVSVPERQRANYAMLIGAHPPIPLDVPAYVGRRPSTPRINGLRMPRLVMVPSPLREVSGTHVEILQQADTVVVTDLGSTNGTTVTVAGFPPRSLRQGESLVVGAETVVDIGDGIRIVIVTFQDEATTEGTP